MNSQEHPQERSKSTPFDNINWEHIENVKYGVVFTDPVTNKSVIMQGSSTMTMSMEDYAKLRVPAGVPYAIIEMQSSINETVPGMNCEEPVTESLNMFYKYLNAL